MYRKGIWGGGGAGLNTYCYIYLWALLSLCRLVRERSAYHLRGHRQYLGLYIHGGGGQGKSDGKNL